MRVWDPRLAFSSALYIDVSFLQRSSYHKRHLFNGSRAVLTHERGCVAAHVARGAKTAWQGSTFTSPSMVSCTDLPNLRRGDIHLWWRYIPQEDEVLRQQLYDVCLRHILDEEEKRDMEASLQQVTLTAAAVERMIARGYLRSVLALYTNKSVNSSDYRDGVDAQDDSSERQIQPAELAFHRNKHGKPKLIHPPNSPIRFNLTHTKNVIGVGVSLLDDIGIDVEHSSRKTRKRRNLLRVAKRYFAPAEQALLEELDCEQEEQASVFIKLWTLKESYVKAVGRGIGAPPGLGAFSFDLRPGPVHEKGNGIIFSSSSEEPDTRSWDFMLLEPFERYIAAVSHERFVADTESQCDDDIVSSTSGDDLHTRPAVTTFVCDNSTDRTNLHVRVPATCVFGHSIL